MRVGVLSSVGNAGWKLGDADVKDARFFLELVCNLVCVLGAIKQLHWFFEN